MKMSCCYGSPMEEAAVDVSSIKYCNTLTSNKYRPGEFTLPRIPFLAQVGRSLKMSLLAPILESRGISLALVGVACLHFGLVLSGLPSIPCPIREALGLPCPGCGLSRAIAALVQGDWQTSLHYHLFAPFFLVAFGLLVAATLSPAWSRPRLIRWIDRFESGTGISCILSIGLVVYWLVRLLFFREAFISLVIG